MAKGDKLGRGFGARYGPSLKQKFNRISKEHRKLHKCPYCGYVKAKRQAVGIWECKKCEAVFTSKAYKVVKAPSIRSAVEDDIVEVSESE